MTPNLTTTPTDRNPAVPSEPTHGCARCGAQVPAGVGLCDECNPLGLRDSAASQVHATVFIGIIVGFLLLAAVARLALLGGGPYPATVDDVTASGSGLAVTLTVVNEGSAEGQTTCRLQDPAQRAGGQDAFVVSPRIAPGASVTFSATVDAFGSTPRPLSVDCRTP